MKTLPTLYKRNTNGSIQQWTMHIDGDKFWSIYGQVDGKLIENTPTICEGKNIGRANATTDEEQAEFEAQAKWDAQVHKGYWDDIDKVDDELEYYKPMLAAEFKKQKKINFPMFIQPKLDGIRCIARASGLMSRNGKPHKACPHIYEALEKFFDAYPNAILDGEFYNHDLKDDFNRIASLIRKSKPTQDHIDEAEEYVQFHIYDVPRMGSLDEDDVYTSRIESFKQWWEENNPDCRSIKILKYDDVNHVNDVKRMFETYISEGYEGAIVRVNAGYQNKRSKNLLKYKEFEDDEFEILDIIEGKGRKSGMAASALMKLPDGREFNSNIKGGYKFYRELLDNKDANIGKMATIQYGNLSPDGIPRFPYLIAIRDYE